MHARLLLYRPDNERILTHKPIKQNVKLSRGRVRLIKEAEYRLQPLLLLKCPRVIRAQALERHVASQVNMVSRKRETEKGEVSAVGHLQASLRSQETMWTFLLES